MVIKYKYTKVVQPIAPVTNAVRSYCPEFKTTMDDGTIQIIEVGADFQVDNNMVVAKARATSEMVTASHMDYKLITSTQLKSKVI